MPVVAGLQVMLLPISFLVRFWVNHHLLDLLQRPVWRVVSGRSCQYINKIVAGGPLLDSLLIQPACDVRCLVKPVILAGLACRDATPAEGSAGIRMEGCSVHKMPYHACRDAGICWDGVPLEQSQHISDRPEGEERITQDSAGVQACPRCWPAQR